MIGFIGFKMKSGRRNATSKRNRRSAGGNDGNKNSKSGKSMDDSSSSSAANKGIFASTKKDATISASSKKSNRSTIPTKTYRDENSNSWAPSAYTAFKALLSARLCAAIWSNISDCDETFNYWEPTHFLLYNSGFQTWEYSPAYALRSYTYLLIHAFPGWLYGHLFQSNKILVFYFLRCLLGFGCAACEAYFYRAANKVFGGHVAKCLLAFLVFSPGLFVSSTAYLPSTFSMYFTMLAIACLLTDKHEVAVLCVAVSAFLGWPFAAVLGVPVAFKILVVDRRWWFFAKWCSFAVIFVLVPTVHVDSYFFGKFVVAPLNIVLYNVFSGHGPELYGVEPWSFYFVNGFLNFNVVFVLALISLPIAALSFLFLRTRTRIGSFLYVSLPMYVWLLIFCATPHKEERFLFPIYPLVCLCGAVCLVHLQEGVTVTLRKFGVRDTGFLSVSLSAVFAVLAVSRIFALYRGYHAPFDVYMEAHRVAQDPRLHPLSSSHPVNLCVGKEWYRFPGSFFLQDNWHLQFVRSDFRGQLPKHFGSGKNATSVVPDRMNDRNLEEPSRYVDIAQCHYLVDLDLPVETPREPRYAAATDQWETIFSVPFLDAARSPRLWRAFYVPFLSDDRCRFAEYKLMKATSLKNRKPVMLGNAHT